MTALSLTGAIASAQGQLDVVTGIDGRQVRGRIIKIDAKGAVHLQDGEELVVRQLAELRQVRVAARRTPGKAIKRGKKLQRVYLRSGAQLAVVIKDFDDRTVTVAWDAAAEPIKLPMRHIGAVRLADTEVESDGGFSKYTGKPKESRDVLSYWRNGKVVQRSGEIQEINAEHVVYEARGKLRKIAKKDLYGLVRAANAGTRPDPQKRPRVELRLRAGERVRGKLVGADGDRVQLRMDEGQVVAFRWSKVSELVVESDRLVFLTDLEPIKVKQTPALDRVWPWFRDRSPSGAGVQLGGKARNASLVLVPRTSLTYRIGGSFDHFQATIGIEDRSKGPAHAIVRVLSGDKTLFTSQPITRFSKPLDIKLPVRGLERLTIEADFGKNLDFGDHCVFAEARLVKDS